MPDEKREDAFLGENSGVVGDGTRSTPLQRGRAGAHTRGEVSCYARERVPSPTTKPFAVDLTLTALPPKPGEPPPAIRLRRLLKIALRGFGFRASWPNRSTRKRKDDRAKPTGK